MKAFSQCIVSGGNLKKPIEYATVEKLLKDKEKLTKASQKNNLEIKFPVGSEFRNETILKTIFGRFLYFYGGLDKEYFYNNARSSSLTECINLSDKNKEDICFYVEGRYTRDFKDFRLIKCTGLLSPWQLDKIKEKEREALWQEERNNKEAGYGEITNVERDEIIAKINTLKTEYEERIRNITEPQCIENEKNGFGHITDYERQTKVHIEKAKHHEEKKEWVYALYYYDMASKTDIDPEVINLATEYKDKRKKTLEDANLRIYSENPYEKIKLDVTSFNSNQQFLLAQADVSKKSKKHGGTSFVANQQSYNELANLIESGNPGRGNFDEFTLYDEWKKLLMEAEKFGTEYGRYKFTIGKLEKKSVDLKTRTATYTASIQMEESEVYKNVIGVIQKGYRKARTKDWKDLPDADYWPMISVSGLSSKSNLVDGVAVYRTSNSERGYNQGEIFELAYRMQFGMSGRPEPKINIMKNALGKPSQTVVYNAFACERAGGAEFSTNDGKCLINSTLYDLSLNIVDENGKELVKPKRELLTCGISGIQYNTDFGVYIEASLDTNSGSIEFSGISQDLMNKIENGTAKVNLVAVYLEYGTYNKADDTVATTGNRRAFVKNFPEIKLSLDKISYEMK